MVPIKNLLRVLVAAIMFITVTAFAASLHDAAEEGDTERVDRLITQGVDVNAKGPDNWTALLLAASAGHVDIVKMLLKNGADPNAKRNDGSTALFESSRDGSVDIVKALLSNGADVNSTTNTGWTALILAAKKGYRDIVQVLLSYGANVNAQVNRNGWTALNLASYFGHIDIVKALLAKGADVNAIDKSGQTALQAASQKGHDDIVNLLVSNGAVPKEIERNAGILLRKDELQRKYDWNGSTTVKTIDSDVTYGLTTALGMKGTALGGHFLLGNLVVRGRVVVVSQGLIVAPNTQISKPGPSSAQVKNVQQRLTELGYNPGPVDGLMGQRTRAAIWSFQRKIGMPKTGEISEQLISKLKSTEFELEKKRNNVQSAEHTFNDQNGE